MSCQFRHPGLKFSIDVMLAPLPIEFLGTFESLETLMPRVSDQIHHSNA
jgi:hypothetical protein